jgi:hypothetical protein
MRKLLVAGVLLSVLIVACETKSPVEPDVTPTTTTTSVVVPGSTTPTTVSTTTTTAVLGSLARSYKAFPTPAPNLPAEMTLFFQLISSVTTAAPPREGAAALTENVYKVTGVFVMGNGTTGTVDGELSGGSNPLETGGEFEGSLTAITPSKCTATRDFLGTVTAVNLEWVGGSPGTSTCSPSPLSFPGISMLRSDPGAPLPTPPPTTSVTTTVATTTVACTYSLSPTSDRVPSGGGARTVNVNTQSGCAWSAQSFADWITIRPPFGGGGPATVTYDVQPSTTARAGTLLIAGIQFPVTQDAPPPPPPPDLVPAPPLNQSCSTTVSGASQTWSVTVPVNNTGPSPAGASTTRGVFESCFGDGCTRIDDRPTDPVPAGGSTPVTFQLPDNCFAYNSVNEICRFTITADYNNTVAEASEVNNSADGSCTRPFDDSGLSARGRGRLR